MNKDKINTLLEDLVEIQNMMTIVSINNKKKLRYIDRNAKRS